MLEQRQPRLTLDLKVGKRLLKGLWQARNQCPIRALSDAGVSRRSSRHRAVPSASRFPLPTDNEVASRRAVWSPFQKANGRNEPDPIRKTVPPAVSTRRDRTPPTRAVLRFRKLSSPADRENGPTDRGRSCADRDRA